MTRTKRNPAHAFGAKIAFELGNYGPNSGITPAMRQPVAAPASPQNLKAQQNFLDASLAQKQKELTEQDRAGWRDFGRRSYVTFGSPAVGEAMGAVARPIDNAARWVGSGVQGVAGRIGSWGLQGAGAAGRAMQNTVGAGAKPLNPTEQAEYKSFQNRVGLENAAPLSPAETSRLQALEARQKATSAANNSRNAWGAFAQAADTQASNLDKAVTENANMLMRGEIPGSKMTTRIVPAANGQPARVEAVSNDPLRQFYNDNANQLNPNSALRQTADIAYGVGRGAANMVAVPAAGKLIGAAGSAMQGARGFQGAANAMQSAQQVFNPNMATLFPSTAAGLGTAGGATALGGFGAYNVAQAQTPEERIEAAQIMPGLALGGAYAGNLLSTAVPSLARGAANAYQNTLYPGQAAAASAGAAAPAATTAAPAMATAAPAVRGALADVAMQTGQSAALTAAQGVSNTAGLRQDADNQTIAQGVAPNDVSRLNDTQNAVSNAVVPNPANIPAAFLPDAAKVMGRTGTGGVGTNAVTHPESGRVMGNDETSDFYNWMQGEGVFKGKDGAPGATEQQAAAQGQSAYDAAIANGQDEVTAGMARDNAYKNTYLTAYRDNQQTQLSQNTAKIEELQAAGASPAEIKPHVDAAVGNYVRGMPERQRQEAAADAKAYAAHMANPDQPPPPEVKKVETNAQQAFLTNASNTDPPPPDPKGTGDWFGQKMEQFNAMPPAAKLALGIGLPMMLVGLMSGGDDEEGGGFGMLLSLLGLGAGLMGAAGGGMFGQGAQNAVIDTLGGLGQSAGLMPKEFTPEQKAILTAKDPIQAVLASSGGNLTREQAAQRVQAAHAQLGQLQQLRSIGGMFGDAGQARLLQTTGLSPEEAQTAVKNIGTLTSAYSDPKSELSAALQNAQWYSDPNKSGLTGWATEQLGSQNVQNVLNWLQGKQGNAHMNIAQQIYLQHEMMKAARCWAGYEPVPGKKPYSEDSCRPSGGGAKKKKEPAKKQAASSVFKLNEKKPEEVVNGAKPSSEASKEVSVKREEPKKETDLRPEEVLPSKA